MTTERDSVRASRYVKRNFIVLSFLCMAEPLSSTILLPFVYFMVKGFGYDESEIGSRAGLITSAFFVVQMFATPVWCIVSDRVGRKPCLIFGLFGSAAAMVLFGLSRSIAWAIATRSLCGLLNGNLAVSRTMVGELAEATNTEKGKAFSIFGFCIAVGWMVGPFIGGLLASPAENMGFYGPWRVFESHPWLLPCLVTAAYNIVVASASIAFLDETNKKWDTKGLDVGEARRDLDRQETRPLNRDFEVRGQRQYTAPVLIDAAQPPEPKSATLRQAQALLMLSSVFYFIHVISFDELYALFAASSLSRGVGLSFGPQQIARSLAVAGPAMILALLTFPALHRNFASLPLYRVTAVVFVLLYPLFSLLPGVGARANNSAELWTLLVCLVVLRYATMVIGLASIQILFNDMVKPRERALMNGLGQSVGSLARAIGPSLGGFSWSWSLKSRLGAPFDFHATFLLLSVLGVGQALTTIGLPNQKQLDDEHKRWLAEDRLGTYEQDE